MFEKFLLASKECIRKSFVFRGRASLSEFLWWQLATCLVLIAASMLCLLQSIPLMFIALFLIAAVIFPSISVAVRRCHDMDHSGWWVLALAVISYIIDKGIDLAVGPVMFGQVNVASLAASGIGMVLMTTFFLRSGTRGPNRFGEQCDMPDAVASRPASKSKTKD